jgi:putative SOS response-associated peptidase YedK
VCGRYTLFSDTEEKDIRDIINEVQRNVDGDIKTGEIFPTDRAPVLIQKQNRIAPEALIWGFPNFRNKGVIINARSETVQEKVMFRKCLFTKRCVIPSTGFYEWSHNGEKLKYQFNLPNTRALYMAGLYNEFDGEQRFVILTTEANNSMSDIHNRMPVVLDREEVQQWVADPESAIKIISEKHPLLEKLLVV